MERVSVDSILTVYLLLNNIRKHVVCTETHTYPHTHCLSISTKH